MQNKTLQNPGPPPRKIVGFTQDEQGDWIAQLECGHTQHVRHNPPWMVRTWVTTEEGRAQFIGHELKCVNCAVTSEAARANLT